MPTRFDPDLYSRVKTSADARRAWPFRKGIGLGPAFRTAAFGLTSGSMLNR